MIRDITVRTRLGRLLHPVESREERLPIASRCDIKIETEHNLITQLALDRLRQDIASRMQIWKVFMDLNRALVPERQLPDVTVRTHKSWQTFASGYM